LFDALCISIQDGSVVQKKRERRGPTVGQLEDSRQPRFQSSPAQIGAAQADQSDDFGFRQSKLIPSQDHHLAGGDVANEERRRLGSTDDENGDASRHSAQGLTHHLVPSL
jgi:hypothetical protein